MLDASSGGWVSGVGGGGTLSPPNFLRWISSNLIKLAHNTDISIQGSGREGGREVFKSCGDVNTSVP